MKNVPLLTRSATQAPLLRLPSEAKSRSAKETALIAMQNEFKGNSSWTQRERLLHSLNRHDFITTIEARRFLDILHPAGRVMELRRSGQHIATLWHTAITEAGMKHRVGLYILRRLANQGFCTKRAPEEILVAGSDGVVERPTPTSKWPPVGFAK